VTGATPASTQLHRIVVQGLPVPVHARAAEHQAELQREFQLILIGSQEHDVDVPKRLFDLIEIVNAQFEAFSTAQNQRLDEAVERGEDTIDLEYQLPEAVKPACISLNRMLDECDDYCRRGESLLTLATPPKALAYRRWFLGEFVAQVDGAAPLPWAQADVDALLASPKLRGE
jgi:hypothetical protein